MKLLKIMAAGAILAGGVALTGCNDLEQPPSSQYTDANFWTQKNVDKLVMTAYTQLYSAGTMWSDEELTDNLYNGYGINDQHHVRRGIATPNLGLFGWNGYYQGIRSCHTYLENVVNVDGVDEAVVKRLNAEARMIRDFLYFRLTNLYGSIPFFMENPTLDYASTLSRTPRSEVIKTITEDLEDLIPDLPKKEELTADENGRITQAAAAVFRARIALMDSDWATVASWCKRIMDGEFGHYELFPTYAGLFAEENEYNCEVILDMGYVQGIKTWGEINNMKPPTLRSTYITWTPTQSLVDTYLTLGGYRIDEDGTDYDKDKPYENRDPRLDATVVRDMSELYDPSTGITHTIYINPKSGVSDDNVVNENGSAPTGRYKTYTGYYTRKWFSPIKDDTGYNSGLNIIMMRYGDVLLMYAEAMNELNQMTATVWDQTIGAIRARAGFTADKALKMPAGDLRQVIRNERRVELALEGLRWWDIKRWKAGSEYLNGPVKGCTHVGGVEVLDNYVFDENRDYLFAVPQSEIDFNPNLKPQNPGYSS